LKTLREGLYNFVDGGSLPEAASNSNSSAKPRRWAIVFAGLLLAALGTVVIYTNRGAFLSPLALVVVAAIGLAALLLQLRLRQDLGVPVRAPVWLNVVGIIFALVAVFADVLRLRPAWMLVAALGAVVCFAVSGIVVLDALRKRRS
jgi:uncharacterized membrane protein HdeD (DUF308 family)